jgi:hypothetical protein
MQPLPGAHTISRQHFERRHLERRHFQSMLAATVAGPTVLGTFGGLGARSRPRALPPSLVANFQVANFQVVT